MKRLMVLLGVFWLVESPLNVLATDNGVLISDHVPGPSVYSPATSALIEAWNDNGLPGYPGTYGSPCFAFNYVPSVTYVLERIEWYSGDMEGTVTTAVRSGSLNGPVLGSVMYQESSPTHWQGANLIPSVLVTAGESYYLVYSVVVGALITGAESGVSVSHWHDPSGACLGWLGPFDSAPWRARFYGTIPTSTQTGTWGRIKAIYR